MTRALRISVVTTLASVLIACAPPPDSRDEFLAFVYREVGGAYEHFAATAATQQAAIGALCESPTDANLATARERFVGLARAWGRVEWLRLGPVAHDHRYDRLFYWPDRGGRGRRQLIELIADTDARAIEATDLKEKSVALQGMPALEYLLFADEPTQAAYRGQNACALAKPVSDWITVVSSDVRSDWQSAGDLQQAFSRSGDPLERDQALAAVLEAGSAALRSHADLKIKAAIGTNPAAARPGIAPLALSGLTIEMIDASVQELARLFGMQFQAVLPEDSRYAGDALQRELRLVRAQLDTLRNAGDWQAVVRDEQQHGRLVYVQIPMTSARQQLGETLPAALGLAQSFNAADGD
ncbi:MAG: imelysin family protein [Pseudomonadota bacterium]